MSTEFENSPPELRTAENRRDSARRGTAQSEVMRKLQRERDEVRREDPRWMRLATFLGGPGSKYLHMPSGWIQDQKTEIFVSATTHIAGYYEKICSHHIVPHILPPWKKTRAQAWMMMILMLKHGETRSGVKHHVTLEHGRSCSSLPEDAA